MEKMEKMEKEGKHNLADSTSNDKNFITQINDYYQGCH